MNTLAVNKGRAFAVGLCLVLIWLVGYPLALTLLEAFGLVGRGSAGFTLEHFSEFARRGDEWLALWRSLWISAASVALAALIGVPLAFLFERTDFPGRRTLAPLLALPIALPPLVGVIAFLFLVGESGFLTRVVQTVLGLEDAPWRLHGPGAILVVHAYSMYVYFYLFTRAGLARLDGSMLEAAAVLGAGRVRTFWRVLLPQLRPALLGAALLTFMTSLGSFSAPYIFAGGFRVMTTQIYASKVNNRIGVAQVEAVVLALLALLALFLIRRLQGDETVASSHGVAPQRRRLGSAWMRLTCTVLGWGLALFLLLPHFTLILISLVPSGTWTTQIFPPELTLGNFESLFREPRKLEPMLSSLWMSAAATAGAATLGFLAARQALRRRGRLGAVLEGLIALPWAVPATVFALALATAFSVNAPHLLRFAWVGTPVLLPLAYLVRSLPLTGRAALAGLRRLDPAIEEAAAILGASTWRSFRKVVLPLVRPALVAGFSLAFITGLGDYVTSIILFTPLNRPISMSIVEALRLELGVAAAYGVLLMTVSAAAFLIWGKGEV